VFSTRSTGRHEQACAWFGALEPPEPDSKVELEVHVEKVEEQVRTALLKAHTMLGRKKAVLSALGCPLPVNFQIDLVNKRNEAGARWDRAGSSL
jgi:hypothetical protein